MADLVRIANLAARKESGGLVWASWVPESRKSQIGHGSTLLMLNPEGAFQIATAPLRRRCRRPTTASRRNEGQQKSRVPSASDACSWFCRLTPASRPAPGARRSAAAGRRPPRACRGRVWQKMKQRMRVRRRELRAVRGGSGEILKILRFVAGRNSISLQRAWADFQKRAFRSELFYFTSSFGVRTTPSEIFWARKRETLFTNGLFEGLFFFCDFF